MEQKKLKGILEKHKLWLKNRDKGERADLRYANLRKTDLRHANLRHADLRNADLSGAFLTSADLSGANLKGADLSGAFLTDADLSFADLEDADLTGAYMWDTNFSGVYWKSIISIQLDTIGENRVINYIPEIDRVSVDCFSGTLEELKNRVKDTHSDNKKIRKRYEKAIEFIEFLKDDYENE